MIPQREPTGTLLGKDSKQMSNFSPPHRRDDFSVRDYTVPQSANRQTTKRHDKIYYRDNSSNNTHVFIVFEIFFPIVLSVVVIITEKGGNANK
jgi:hypothetical protein